MSDFFDKSADSVSFNKIIDDNGELQKFERSNIRKAFIIFAEVVIANTLVSSVLTLLMGPAIATAVTAIVVAPINEEYGKLTAEKAGCNKEYFVIFNAFEFTDYVVKLSYVKGIIGLRLAAVGMHAVNTAIHKAMNNPKIQEKLKLNDKEGKEKATLISYISTILIHASWNTASIAGLIG